MMKFKANYRSIALNVAVAVVMVASVSSGFTQTPAQKPLLSKTGIVVPPNLMLTLDDSGSMQFQHMPETVFAGGTYATANPVGSDQVRWTPDDTYQVGYLLGTVPGNTASTNYVLKALRSPDTNTIFYNPEKRYLPWLTSDGVTRRVNSNPAAAHINPLLATGTTINLTTYVAPAGNGVWCYAAASTAAATGAGCATYANNAVTHDPGVYFRLQKADVSAGSFVVGSTYTIKTVGSTSFTAIGASANTVGITFVATGVGTGSGVATAASAYKAVNSSANYTGYSINVVPGAGVYPYYPERTDCASTGCTQAQERQNFANWFTYYRSRNLMTRGSLMEVFGTVDNIFRLGFGRINKTSATVDGYATKVIESNTADYGGGGVRAFDATRKQQLFKWLEALPASGGTPLVTALQSVGEYFSRTDAKGPWTDNPGLSGNSVSDNKNCRRSYNFMATDGYWNGAVASVDNIDGDPTKNIDSSTGLPKKITGVGGSSYSYIPSHPYSDGASNTLADVAMYYWYRDLQTGMDNNVAPVGDNISFWQNLTNYTIGLGVRGTLNPNTDLPALSAGTTPWPAASASTTAANIDDLWHAAVNSRGAYFSAADPSSLALAVKGALAGVQGGSGSTAGVATASTVLENTNRKYVPTYHAGEWSGDISALPLDANGQTTSAVWKASERIPAWSVRKIYTWDKAPLVSPTTPGAVDFSWSTLSSGSKAAMSTSSTVPATYTTSFVNFIKGDHTNEGVGNPFRLRTSSAGAPFVLGDFINSNPVLIKSSFDGGYGPLLLGGATGYQNFITAKAARDAVLFVGANDGMLHAFKDTKGATSASAATDGQEIFAYIPRAIYSNLYKLSDKNYGGSTLEHQYFVDGPQRESDAYVRGPGSTFGTRATTPSWRNYLTGTLGAGGRAIYALDVTDSPNLTASAIRWEISSADDGDIGYITAPVEVGVLPSGRWVAIVGNGFASDRGYATLLVIDLETAAIQKLNVETATGSNGLGGVAVVKNSSGQITNLYAGDLSGKLWKFDYNSDTSPFVVSGGSAMFTALNSSGTAQPITQAPGVFDHSKGGKIIVFGTGKLFATADATDTSTQTIYGVWDMPADPKVRPLTRSLLQTRSLAAVNGTGNAVGAVFYTLAGVDVDWINQRGWYIDLYPATTGGRVIYPVQAIGSKIALVSVVAPAQAAVICQPSDGIGIDLTIDAEGGSAPSYHLYDTNGDNAYNGGDALVAGYKTNADGIDSVVYSPSKNSTDNNATDGVCGAGYYRVSIQTSTGQQLICVKRDNTAPASSNRVYTRVSRRIINPPIR
jgi:type IV pilus assembly protein PilY1